MAVRIAKRSKYNVRTDRLGRLARTLDGVVYDSVAERNYAAELEVKRKAGLIAQWERQAPFSLDTYSNRRAVTIGFHCVDFLVTLPDRKTQEAHEVKGYETELWKWKRKHFQAQYPHIKYVVVKA